MIRTAVSILVLFLSACSLPDQNDYVLVGAPSIEVSHTKAAVGEPVTVTLTSNFRLREQSRVSSRSIEDVSLGGCFATIEDDGEYGESYGFCAPTLLPMPSELTLLEDSKLVKNFGTFVLERGESLRLRHSFIFTTVEAGTFGVEADMLYTRVESGGPSVKGGFSAIVVFE